MITYTFGSGVIQKIERSVNCKLMETFVMVGLAALSVNLAATILELSQSKFQPLGLLIKMLGAILTCVCGVIFMIGLRSTSTAFLLGSLIVISAIVQAIFSLLQIMKISTTAEQ